MVGLRMRFVFIVIGWFGTSNGVLGILDERLHKIIIRWENLNKSFTDMGGKFKLFAQE